MQDKEVVKHFSHYLSVQIKHIDRMVKPNTKEINFDDVIMTSLQKGEYLEAILTLKESEDHRRNIRWYKLYDFRNKNGILRDGRQPKVSQMFDYERYVIIGVNVVLAALDLLKLKKNSSKNIDDIKNTANFITLSLTSLYITAKNIKDEATMEKCLERFESVVTTHLAPTLELSPEEVQNRLTVAKEFCLLKTGALHMVTITDLYDRNRNKTTFFEASLALTELTPELREEYNNRKKSKWFTNLPSWQQELIDSYAENILSGKALIPTQLRYCLVGLRNTYLEICGVYKEETATVLHSCYRSGAIVYLGGKESPDENKRINSLHAAQLKATTKAQILSLTLNTDINLSGNDREIVTNTEIAVKEVGGLHINLPLNNGRHISFINYTDLNALLKTIAEKFVTDLRNRLEKINSQHDKAEFFKQISDYLCGNYYINLKEEEKVNGFIKTLNDVKKIVVDKEEQNNDVVNLTNIIELALIICMMKKVLPDTDYRNLVLACNINILVDLLSYHMNIAANISCESGKDRTGLVIYRTTAIVANRYLLGMNCYSLLDAETDQKELATQNSVLLATTLHQQRIAGFWKGTFGLKEDSKSAFPASEFPKEVCESLFNKSASYNKETLYHASWQRFYFPLKDRDLNVHKACLSRMIKILYANNLLLQKKEPFSAPPSEVQVAPPLAENTAVSTSAPVLPVASNSSGFWQKISPYIPTFLTPEESVSQDSVVSIESHIDKAASFSDLHTIFTQARKYIAVKIKNSDLIKCFDDIIQNLDELRKLELVPQKKEETVLAM